METNTVKFANIENGIITKDLQYWLNKYCLIKFKKQLLNLIFFLGAENFLIIRRSMYKKYKKKKKL